MRSRVISLVLAFMVVGCAKIKTQHDAQVVYYEDLRDLNPKVLTMALHAQESLQNEHKTNSSLVTIIDYSKPSNEKRFWTIDTKSHQVLFHDYVAHGRGSGRLNAMHFSNKKASKETSLGVYLTGSTYQGKHGLSLKLIGLEPGFNNHALSRHIVIHGANYVSQHFVKRHGYLGRSWGCPAVDNRIKSALINTIKKGSVIFAYYPDKQWLSHSKFI